METSLGNRNPAKRCPPWSGNRACAGAGDNEPAGWKAAALPLPHAATPTRTAVARNARRTRIAPPRRIGMTVLSQPEHRHPPDPSNKLQTDLYGSQPVRRIQGGDYSWAFPRL